MKRRPSGDLWLLAAMLLALALVSGRLAATGAPSQERGAAHRSIAVYDPTGWRALSLLLKERDLPVAALERPAKGWPPSARLIVTGPAHIPAGSWTSPTAWTEREAARARSWLERGGTLLVFTDEDSALLKALGYGIAETGRASATAAPVPGLGAFDPAWRLVLAGRARLTRLPPGATPLAREGGRLAAAAAPHGRGWSVVVASAAIADNAHLAEGDNARFIVRLVEALAGSSTEPVRFDEYRQGSRDAESVWAFLGPAGQALVWQVAAVALLALGSVSRRFGLPRPLPPRSRVSAEYVASLADLHRRAGATEVALETLYESFRRELCLRLGAPTDLPDDALAAQAGAQRGADTDGLRSLLATCRAHLAPERRPLAESRLVALAQQLERRRKELGIGGDERHAPRG